MQEDERGDAGEGDARRGWGLGVAMKREERERRLGERVGLRSRGALHLRRRVKRNEFGHGGQLGAWEDAFGVPQGGGMRGWAYGGNRTRKRARPFGDR